MLRELNQQANIDQQRLYATAEKSMEATKVQGQIIHNNKKTRNARYEGQEVSNEF